MNCGTFQEVNRNGNWKFFPKPEIQNEIEFFEEKLVEILAGLQRHSTTVESHLFYLTVFSSFGSNGIKIYKGKYFSILFPVILTSSPFPLVHRTDAFWVCSSKHQPSLMVCHGSHKRPCRAVHFDIEELGAKAVYCGKWEHNSLWIAPDQSCYGKSVACD